MPHAEPDAAGAHAIAATSPSQHRHGECRCGDVTISGGGTDAGVYAWTRARRSTSAAARATSPRTNITAWGRFPCQCTVNAKDLLDIVKTGTGST